MPDEQSSPLHTVSGQNGIKNRAYPLRMRGFLVTRAADACLLGVDSAVLHRNPPQPQTRGGGGGGGRGSGSSSRQQPAARSPQLLPVLSSKVL